MAVLQFGFDLEHPESVHNVENIRADRVLYTGTHDNDTLRGWLSGLERSRAAAVRAAGVDGWQLHRSNNAGVQNFPDDRIANLDESTAHWIKISARDDGSFTVTNARTGSTHRYGSRKTNAEP
jgi:4-alpha-glucanotransferase